jgi:hypothetical protein
MGLAGVSVHCTDGFIIPGLAHCLSPATAASLGLLPPPQSVASVPTVSMPQSQVMVTTPAQSTSVSWATGPSPSFTLGPSDSAPHHQPAPPTQSGLMLSPAAEIFPQKLVEKVKGGKFVEMKELLVDNIALVSQLEAVQGSAALPMVGPTRPRLREVTSLPTWCYCFLGFMAMQTSDPVTRDQLTYARLLIKEAQRHGGRGWLDYDRAFRQHITADPNLRWNNLNPGLQASTILGQRSGSQGSFCTLCREGDHTRAQCALAFLEPTVQATSTPVNTWRKPRPSPKVCLSWNRGACLFPGECTYQHECATCQSRNHKARDCPKTPESSLYKRRPGAPRPQQSTT